MENIPGNNPELPKTVVCICGESGATLESLRESLVRRIGLVEVRLFRSLSEISPNNVDPAKIDANFLVLFSIAEQEWRRIAHRRSSVWPLSKAVASFALTDSAEKEFLCELFEAGVDDYFLDVPAGQVAAVGRIVREIERRNMVESFASERHGLLDGTDSEEVITESLAERVRRETFRETVATINHEINNPLSEILATVEMLESQGSESIGLRIEGLREIQNSARRIQQVTMRLQDLVNPDSYGTPAGNMIDISKKVAPRIKSRLTDAHLGRAKVKVVSAELSSVK